MKNTMVFIFIATWALFNAQEIKFTEYDLDNGLHVILHQDNTNPVVTVSVLYHVGSKNEKPNRTGFAHFFEHLLFEGSANIGRGEFDKYIANAGGTNNAFTNKDFTFYYETFPSNQLGLGIWLESERMLHAKVEEKGIETQREVVKEEKRLRYDNQAYRTAFNEVIWENLFTNHPYKWSTIGSMDDLNAATEEDYKNFYKTYYVPNNATLSIAGDINIEEAKKLINDYFGSIPKGTHPINRPNQIETPITQEIKVVYDDKNAQIPALMMAYRGPKQTDKEAYILSIIGDILSQGESSRLNKVVVNEAQEAVNIGSFLYGLEDYGAFILYAVANNGTELSQLNNTIDKVIDDLLKNGITQKELDTQINKLENQFISSNQTMYGIAQSLAEYHTFYGDSNLINTELKKYKEVTVEDVKRVANKYLNKNQRVVIDVIPVKS